MTERWEKGYNKKNEEWNNTKALSGCRKNKARKTKDEKENENCSCGYWDKNLM